MEFQFRKEKQYERKCGRLLNHVDDFCFFFRDGFFCADVCLGFILAVAACKVDQATSVNTVSTVSRDKEIHFYLFLS